MTEKKNGANSKEAYDEMKRAKYWIRLHNMVHHGNLFKKKAPLKK